jgi:hypothetical protein
MGLGGGRLEAGLCPLIGFADGTPHPTRLRRPTFSLKGRRADWRKRFSKAPLSP